MPDPKTQIFAYGAALILGVVLFLLTGRAGLILIVGGVVGSVVSLFRLRRPS